MDFKSFAFFGNNVNSKCFLRTKLERFLKDLVMLKTGLMAAENSILPSQE